jgi:hypothetical protein
LECCGVGRLILFFICVVSPARGAIASYGAFLFGFQHTGRIGVFIGSFEHGGSFLPRLDGKHQEQEQQKIKKATKQPLMNDNK